MFRTHHPASKAALTAVTAVALLLSGTTAATGAAAVPTAGAAPTTDLATGSTTPGLTDLLAHGTPSGRAIATFAGAPTSAQVAALKALGLTVQPMKRLPLALVSGTVSQIQAAVTSGVANDVYPDEKLQLLDTTSSDAMGSAQLRADGLTGKGVTVGVVDSGCDATHPDLAQRVKHNVSLVSGEYANLPADSSTTLVVPMDRGPYSNTDLGSGHGTHVAGIIAADSSSVSDGSRLGVAPDADLACFAIGAVLFTTAVVTAYDYMLDQPDLLGIDVVNNSWGNSYRQFDPRDPVAVATRAVVDQGVTVVFAAGNSGAKTAEMSLNPFSQSPWVISVAAGDVDKVRGSFSSNGLTNDNSQPTGITAGGHTVYFGDRVGVVHPDVTAPGVDISSTCDSTGTVVGPCAPGENTEASGTSMASPHVAGAAAVLKQANPELTPDQVRLALQATASPVTTTDGRARLQSGRPADGGPRLRAPGAPTAAPRTPRGQANRDGEHDVGCPPRSGPPGPHRSTTRTPSTVRRLPCNPGPSSKAPPFDEVLLTASADTAGWTGRPSTGRRLPLSRGRISLRPVGVLLVSGGGLEPPRPIKGTSTSS